VTTSRRAPDDVAAVALDLDGTLAGADHRVSDRAIRALAALEARGVRPIIVTGRTTRAAIDPARAAGLTTPVISCNGTVVTAPDGTRLLEADLDPAVPRDLLAAAEDTGLSPTLWTADAIHVARWDRIAELQQAINGDVPQVGPLEPIAAGRGVVKGMLGGDPDRLDACAGRLAERLPAVVRSMPEFFETINPDASKKSALAFVLDRLGIDPARTIAVGDGETDLPMFQLAGEGVAMANARDTVRAAADTVIGHHAEDGVAVFLEERFGLG